MKRIKAGDTIVVITGNDKGKKGKVLSVMMNKIVVEGINLRKKFVKKNVMGNNQEGTMVEIERPFHISNVQLVDPKTGKPTRVTYKVEGDKKVRVSKKSGEIVVPVALESDEKEEKKEEPKKKTKKVVKSKAKKNESA